MDGIGETVMEVEWFDARQVAARARVSVRTVRNWQRIGILPYVKIGGVVRFNSTSVAAALGGFEHVGYKISSARRRSPNQHVRKSFKGGGNGDG